MWQQGYRNYETPALCYRNRIAAGPVQELMQQTKEHEDALMRLMIERNELSCEYAKMPAHGGRTLADRRRKVVLNSLSKSLPAIFASGCPASPQVVGVA